MGKIIVSEFVSLDGVMEAPGGEPGFRHGGWVMKYPDQAWLGYKLAEVRAHGALLIGRRTYESFAAAWPSRTGEFADKMNSMPKFVASTTLKKASWNNTTIINGDVAEAAARLKKEFAGDILVAGSRTLVNTLRSSGLVDEYRLLVFPVILGSGKRLFEEYPEAAALKLVEARKLGADTALLTYRPNN